MRHGRDREGLSGVSAAQGQERAGIGVGVVEDVVLGCGQLGREVQTIEEPDFVLDRRWQELIGSVANPGEELRVIEEEMVFVEGIELDELLEESEIGLVQTGHVVGLSR